MRVLLLLLLVGCQPGYGGHYQPRPRRALDQYGIQVLGDPEHGRIMLNHYGLGAHSNQYGEEVKIVRR